MVTPNIVTMNPHFGVTINYQKGILYNTVLFTQTNLQDTFKIYKLIWSFPSSLVLVSPLSQPYIFYLYHQHLSL